MMQPRPLANSTLGLALFRDPNLAQAATRLRGKGVSYDEIAHWLGYPTPVEAKRAIWKLGADRCRPDDERCALALLQSGADDPAFWLEEVRESWLSLPWRPDWVWRAIFAREGARHVMRPDEQDLLEALPPIVKVFRGVLRDADVGVWNNGHFSWTPYADDDGPDLGFSWTPHIETAALYSGNGNITQGLVDRRNVLAVFDHIETEILVLPEHVAARADVPSGVSSDRA